MVPATPAMARDGETVPRHLAIIMDGNGRWARSRGLPRIAGHQRGAEAVREVVRGCADLGIEFLTLYAFSSENWRRPADEVSDLMGLLRVYVRREVGELRANNVRLRFIGDRAALAPDIQELIAQAEQDTHQNTGLNLVIAINYGSQNEIVAACRSIAEDVRAGRLQPEQIDAPLIQRNLQTAGVPDPDVVIRTSGEKRLSNFLLWQVAYSELIFLDTLWPDFSRRHLIEAVAEYQRRERRYGAT